MSRNLQPSASLCCYFGWRLRFWRRRSGLTQQELGELLGYDHSHLSKVETGDRWPPEDLPARADRLLGAGGELTTLWPLVERERQQMIRRGQAVGRERFGDDAGPSPQPTRAEVVSAIDWLLARAYSDLETKFG